MLKRSYKNYTPTVCMLIYDCYGHGGLVVTFRSQTKKQNEWYKSIMNSCFGIRIILVAHFLGSRKLLCQCLRNFLLDVVFLFFLHMETSDKSSKFNCVVILQKQTSEHSESSTEASVSILHSSSSSLLFAGLSFIFYFPLMRYFKWTVPIITLNRTLHFNRCMI